MTLLGMCPSMEMSWPCWFSSAHRSFLKFIFFLPILFPILFFAKNFGVSTACSDCFPLPQAAVVNIFALSTFTKSYLGRNPNLGILQVRQNLHQPLHQILRNCQIGGIWKTQYLIIRFFLPRWYLQPAPGAVQVATFMASDILEHAASFFFKLLLLIVRFY